MKCVNADVVVFGAGPAGLAAAITAAKRNLKVYLIENTNRIGGVLTVCQGMMLGAGYPTGVSVGGFFSELVDPLLNAKRPQARRFPSALENFGDEVIYNYDTLISNLYEMLDKYNVNLQLNTITTAVNMSENNIVNVELVSPSDNYLIQAKTYIDTTGNGDIAAMANVPFEKGNKDGLMMGATLTFIMNNVDCDKVFVNNDDPYFEEYAKKAISEGKIHESIPQIYMIRGFDKDTVYFNTVTVTGVDGCDNNSVTKATAVARKRVMELANFCIEEIPGFENSYISTIGSSVGVRETRRLEGMYTLMMDDLRSGTKFDDGVVACDNPLDEVFRDEETTHYSHEAALEEGYYTIPFRTLVPKQVTNLLFAGRNLSVDVEAFASVRGMPQCMILGESVAYGAIYAIENNCNVQQIDINYVRSQLKDNGVTNI